MRGCGKMLLKISGGWNNINKDTEKGWAGSGDYTWLLEYRVQEFHLVEKKARSGFR